MSVDLNKLTAAPWAIGCGGWRVGAWKNNCKVICDTGTSKASRNEENAANAAFIALARNAFDGDPEALAWWEENRRKR